jgi:hypothetical protein
MRDAMEVGLWLLRTTSTPIATCSSRSPCGKSTWTRPFATDYPHSDGFFRGAPNMIRERLEPLSPEAKHQVLAGGAMGFYRLN